MNRFWGRNEHGVTPRFSRDDEQLLALNYENLCDGDYLNRLFGSEPISSTVDDFTGMDSSGKGSDQHETASFNIDLSEDVIIYGNDLRLGRSFCHARFGRQLTSTLRHQDSVTSLFSRQAVVFEHIGKLMIERCVAPSARLSSPKLEQYIPNTENASCFSTTALDCCLNLLEEGCIHNLNCTNLLPLISLVFHIGQESTIKQRHPTLLCDTTKALSHKHIGLLRNIFTRSAMQCHEVAFAEKSRAVAEEAFRTSMASFYGLLALGLHTGNASEILAAITHLMLILFRAEEWYEWFRAESKVHLSTALAAAASMAAAAPLPEKVTTQSQHAAAAVAAPPSTASANTKLSLKGKTAAEAGKSKASNKVANPVAAQPGAKETAALPLGGAAVPSAQLPVLPSLLAGLGADRVPSASGALRLEHTTSEEVRTESAAAIGGFPPGQLGSYSSAHNNSNPNMKLWETPTSTPSSAAVTAAVVIVTKPSASKLPAEKDRLGDTAAVSKKPSKALSLKAEARVIQEILDPNMFSAQELSAYYASNPCTVNYALKGNNQGGEQQQALVGKMMTKKAHPAGGNKSNNQPKAGVEAMQMDGAASHRSGSNAPSSSAAHSNPAAAVARHKKAMLEFKDTLQSLLNIPKPVLKVLHDTCAAVATSTADAGRASSSTAPTSTATATSATTKPASETAATAVAASGGSTYVWSCGQNSYGELGLGDAVMRKSFARVACLDDKRIISIGAGNEHSLFVTREGKLLTAGYNDNGQCGVGSTLQVRQPTVVTALEDEIAQVHVYNGCEHTLAVTRDGKIYSFGYNYRGQLGLGSTLSEQTPRPIRGLLSRRVVLAACSYHHSFMLCSDGALFSCGRNDSGQLGHGDLIDKKTPQSVLNCPRGITTLSCGQFHTVAGTAAGAVFVCGKNDYGQIGIEGSSVVKVFVELPAHAELEQVAQVCCGYYHTLLLSNTGVVAGFGRNDYGQLGLGHAQPKIFACTVIASLRDKAVRMVSAGCYHSVVTTANGMLYVFGRNNHGQLASGDAEERHSPHPVDDFVGQRILAVAAGFYHTLVLTAPAAGGGDVVGVKSSSSSHQVSLGSAVADLVEPQVTSASLGLEDSPLHPMMNDGRLAAASAFLMKDATQLTGIKASLTAPTLVVPFSLERLSKVSSRELLVFLTTHLDSLVGTVGVRGHPASVTAAATKAAVAQIEMRIHAPTPAWITHVLCCAVAAMEVCCGVLADTSGARALPLSVEEALTFLLKAVRTCGGLLRDFHAVLLQAIEVATSSDRAGDLASAEAGLEYLSDLLSQQDSKKYSNLSSTKPNALSSVELVTVFRKCARQVRNKESKEEIQAFTAVLLLRKKLLEMYFTLTQKEQPQNPKFHAIATEIALIFGQSYRVLLPAPSVVAEFLSTLKEYTMPHITALGISAFHQSLCVRLMTIFCAAYRNNEEVVRSFQESKLDSIAVFRSMLALYGHFSMHSLVKRMHATRPAATGVIGSGGGPSAHSTAQQADVRRLVSVLEHCISNFIKCCIPVIFAAGSPAAREAPPAHTQKNAAIFQAGTELVREVLVDAVRLVDYVLSQQQSEEDMLGQLRYGTIMPSILPSILIYGIAFAKHRCVMLDIVPDVSRLIHKLQMIGRPTEGVRAATGAHNVPHMPSEKRSTGLPSSPQDVGSFGGSFRAAVGHLSNSISTALEGAAADHSPSKDVADAGGDGGADGFAEEALTSKRDPQQMSWWYRLVRLSTTFVAKISASLICPAPEGALLLPALLTKHEFGITEASVEDQSSSRGELEWQNSPELRRVAFHPVWKFTSFAAFLEADPSTVAQYVNSTLALPIDAVRAPTQIVELCATYRDKEKSTDHVYRMLSQSVQSMFSTNILNVIEESLLETVVKVCGQAVTVQKMASPAFTLISRFTKLIHSHRSELMGNAGETSWVELLISLNNVVRLLCQVLMEGSLCVRNAVPLPLPTKILVNTCAPAETKCNSSTQARGRWRRAMMVVFSVIRWKTAVRLHMKQLASNVIDFVTSSISAITAGFTSLPTGAVLSDRVCALLQSLLRAQREATDYDLGINMALALLGDLSSNALRCDVLGVVMAAMREKAETLKSRATAPTAEHGDVAVTVLARSMALQVRPRAGCSFTAYLLRCVMQLRGSAASYTHHELMILSSAVKLLQLFTFEPHLNPQSSARNPLVPLSTLKSMLLLLKDRQNSASASASSALSADDRTLKKSSASARERTTAYRRTTQDLLNLLQATVSNECAAVSGCRPHLCAQLLDLHNFLIATYQQQRVETMKLDAINEEAARLSLEGKDSSQLSATHAGLLVGSSSTAANSKQQSKDGNRRRCQELITKPVEFCRSVEGFVVQGEKLLNNFKGVDFTMCFWMLVAKKTTVASAKQHSAFITGKVSHSDAWPVVLLRSDGKVEVVFGHASELEKIVSMATVVQSVWTHIAVIVEQKKIKLFINGVLDCAASPSKGNTKAVLFPLLVGTCPSNVRTKIAHVKEGLDGMLAQYKYYSRALSPIHVKVVHDGGPPDSSDVSARLIYQMLASMKGLLRPLDASYVAPSLKESAGIMHMLFVTDTCSRTRFAALDLLVEILLKDAVEDMSLWSNWSCPSSTEEDPQAVSLLTCSFIKRFATFRERLVLYLLRLAGACWAPHLLAGLENPHGAPGDGMPGSIAHLMGVHGSRPQQVARSEESQQMHEFLRFAPCLAISADARASSSPYALNQPNAGVSFVDKLAAKKEARLEICSHVLRALTRLSAVPAWNTAISAVVCNTLDTSRAHVEALTAAPLPLRFDTMGVTVLLGGGTSGPFLGAEVRNFFGDSSGRVLNVNKTTNFATMLTWNALYAHQQIVKVRVSDLIVTPRQDMLPLSSLTDAACTRAVLSYLDALSPFVPLLLSDYMSSLRPPESVLQRTILKGLRPTEIFHFTQLLHAVVTVTSASPTSVGALSSELCGHPALLRLLQQATLAALEVQPSSAVHHLGDNRAAYSPPSMASMWLGCANYLCGVPDRVVARPLLGVEEVRALCEFVGRNFSMSAESILVAPHAKLLKQGRMGELAQLLSLSDGAAGPIARSEFTQMVQLAEGMHADAAAGTVDTSGYSGLYLMSDWPPTFAVDWPTVTHDSLRNELYCGYMLALLFHMRKDIVASARTIMTHNCSVEQGHSESNALTPTPWLREAAIWQALLPHSPVDARFPLDTLADLLQARSAVSWRTTCEALYQSKRTEVTLTIAASLKHFAVTLLQINPVLMKSADNLFESLDLFKRVTRAALCWVEYADAQAGGEEVSVALLKTLMPHLSLIDNRAVELQLTQLCMHIVRKLAVRTFGAYAPSKELLEIAKSNNFTLLRARAQEQVTKFKTHNMGSVSALAYNLTQLVSGMEIIQRQGAAHSASARAATSTTDSSASVAAASFATPPGSAVKAAVSSAHKSAQVQHTARIQSAETAAPKISAVRANSVDCDLTPCAESALSFSADGSLQQTPTGVSAGAEKARLRDENVMIEVAIGTTNANTECFFETVYCGSSLRLVQSNLVPDCAYFMKCRAYSGVTPLAWSPVVEFRTQKGTLFTFDAMKCGADIRLGEDGLTASYGNDDTWSSVLGSRAFSSGVTHWNIRINSSSTAYIFVGAATSAADLNSFLGGCAHGWGFIGEQALYHNREKVKVYGESFSSGDVVGVTLDLNQGTISFSRNGKPLGVAFEKVYGELYPAAAFYNVGQELEILSEGCHTSCAFESIPISPSHLSMDDISLLSELVLSLYRKHPLSHRMQVLVAEHCNQWCLAGNVRCRAVSGRDVFLATESALLAKFGLTVGEKVRTPFGVADVAGTAFNKVWFTMNPAGEVWYFTVQQILDGRAKKLFLRCSYDGIPAEGATADSCSSFVYEGDADSSMPQQVLYDAASIQELLEPGKWSEDMDQLLQTFLSAQAEAAGQDSAWRVTSQQVTDNFRSLQQQFSRMMVDSHELSHRWGITGPKRKAVLARIGLLRLLNQMLDLYLPFLVADSSSRAFVQNQPTLTDEFAPMIVSLRAEESGALDAVVPAVARSAAVKLWNPPTSECNAWPLVSLSWDDATCSHSVESRELLVGPIHAIRRLIFFPMKKDHFWEVVKSSATRPAKTEDDYDYPDDLPHVKINRLKSFRAREASELLLIPGEDLMLSSMFCQLWRELRQHNDEMLRISYTHPMDDGQSRTFKIKFEGEGVDDYGGPYREIFQQICEELQSTDPSVGDGGSKGRPSSWLSGEDKQHGEGGHATASSAIAALEARSKPGAHRDGDSGGAAPSPTRCFLPLLMPTPNWTADADCTERYRYMFHPAAESPLKMDLFHFLGQLVGIAVRSKITLDLALPSYVWKYVVCERLTEQDIASFDAPAYTTLQRLGGVHKQLEEMHVLQARGEQVDASALAMLQYNALELVEDLTWSYTRSDGAVIELIEGKGRQPVELADVGRYLVLYAEARLSEGRNAIGMFRRGLISILPESALSLLTWEELQATVCGPRTIDVQRLKDNTEYDDDLSPEDDHIVLFWEVLSGFSEAEKSAFLRFVWARPTLPPKGVEFSQKMRVLSAVGDDAHLKPDQYLPKAHTCFFSINLPKYSTKELMTEKLLYAIFNCTEMDADFRTTEADVAGWGGAPAVPADWHASGPGDYN